MKLINKINTYFWTAIVGVWMVIAATILSGEFKWNYVAIVAIAWALHSAVYWLTRIR